MINKTKKIIPVDPVHPVKKKIRYYARLVNLQSLRGVAPYGPEVEIRNEIIPASRPLSVRKSFALNH